MESEPVIEGASIAVESFSFFLNKFFRNPNGPFLSFLSEAGFALSSVLSLLSYAVFQFHAYCIRQDGGKCPHLPLVFVFLRFRNGKVHSSKVAL